MSANMGANMSELLGAMAAHDFTRLPLTATARYTENGQSLSFGDGLWGTLTGFAGGPPLATVDPGRFRVDLANATEGSSVFFGATVETSTPGVLMLRMKTQDARISEVEALCVRVETTGERGGTVTLFQPPLLAQLAAGSFADNDIELVTSAPDPAAAAPALLTAIVDGYFRALVTGNSRGVAFSEHCQRRDNGVLTSRNTGAAPLDAAQPDYRPYSLDCAAQIDSGFFRNFSRLRGVRHLAIDTARGLVMSVALLDQPGDVEGIDVAGIGKVRFPAGASAEELASTEGTPQFYVKRHEPNFRVPLTQLMAQLTRIEKGKIVRMEAISRPAPYGIDSGWPS